MRIVIDTNILIAGLRSTKGASAELLRKVIRGELTLLLSVPLVLEYEAIASGEHQIEASVLTADQIQQVIDALVSVCEQVRPKFSWRPQLRDPADEMVLETAINGRATAIVTFNRRDFVGATERFDIEIITPNEVLRRTIK